MNKFSIGLILAILSVLLMSFESPAISLVSVGGFDYLFLFGSFVCISSFTMSLVSLGLNGIRSAIKKDAKILALGALSLGISNSLFIFAVKFAGVALPVFIYACSPLICAAVDKIIFKKTTPKSIFITTFFVIIGIGIAVSDGLDFSSLIGILLSFISVICFALLCAILSNHKNISRTLYISGGGLVAMLISVAFATFNFSLNDFFVIALIGLFITPISRVLVGVAALYLISAQIALIVILESILAPIWAGVFLGQNISLNLIIGGAILLTAMAFYCFFTMKNST